PQRIWWCPAGPFTSLPLHAAGLYTPFGPEITLSDFAISSYTPTLSSLISATEDRSRVDFKLLVVTQPCTPGETPLPGTADKAKCIRQRAQSLPTVMLEGERATKEEVLRHSETCTWIHLTCHGLQNGRNSQLLLQDGGLKVSEIFKLPTTSQLEFVFLSACQTSTGEEHLPDEGLHMAGVLQMVGCRSVIGTMSSILDEKAPFISDMVYEDLFRQRLPEYTETARALHGAVQHLRSK
ncbi:CHAT domain-containing protein, partial [Mycena rebaudengoi]